MKYIVVLYMSLSAFSLSVMQSTPELYWKVIDSPYFKIIHADYSEHEAKEIEKYLYKYRRQNSKTYSLEPSQFTLILRPQMATQNGFVTLGPSRSEWYSSTSINATLGSLSWYEALAVHEYRHFVQFENLDTGLFKIASALFGDIGLSIAIGWTTHSWYFEGDAVWAETEFTEAGRGRSARFFKLAKSLIRSGNFPTLDELLAGDRRFRNPNHYVWGYLIISKAIRDYGKNIWDNITMEIPSRIYSPFAIYTAFRAVTGKEFNVFYEEMINELKLKWGMTEKVDRNSNYTEVLSPLIDNENQYTFSRDLDNHLSLLKNNIKLFEINISPSESKVDIRNDTLIYSKTQRHPRFAFKETSDLYRHDILTNTVRRVTNGKRYYHPNFINDNEVLLVEFNKQNKWLLKSLNLDNLVEKTIEVVGNINEAIIYKDSIFYISQNDKGEKSIRRKKNESDTLILGPTRNVLYNLRSTDEGVVFEADFKDLKVKNILYKDMKFYLLKNSDEFSFYPNIHKGKYIYTSTDQDGEKLKMIPLNLEEITKNEIVNVYSVTSKSQKTAEFSKGLSKDYNEFDGLNNPHSWSFIGSRGYQLSGAFSNYLGTYEAELTAGYNTEDKTNFGTLRVGYMKYYPIADFFADFTEKNEEIYSNSNSKSLWKETLIGTRIIFPYSKRFNFYKFNAQLKSSYYYVDIDGKSNRSNYSLNDDTAKIREGAFRLSYMKDKTYRQVHPSLGFSTDISYSHANLSKREGNYSLNSKSEIYTPGFLKNHGIKLVHMHSKQKSSFSAYRISTGHLSSGNFRFSRENTYSFYPETNRYIANYTLPLWNRPVRLLGDWLFVGRVVGNVFSDNTTIKKTTVNDEFKLYAHGIDLEYESLIMRKIPAYFTMTYVKTGRVKDPQFIWSLTLNHVY